MGDFNINILEYEKNREVEEFLDTLNSHLIIPSILFPTRITDHSETLIDNIYFSHNKYNLNSGNLMVGISDHLPQFALFEMPHQDLEPRERYYRDWKSFDCKKFRHDFNNIDWNKNLKLELKDPNISFDFLMETVTMLIDKHVQLKKLTNKQKKCANKPWVTKGIRKSIYRRNNLFRKFVKTKDPHKKLELHENYKQLRNAIVNLLRISKQNHYRNYFAANLKNSKNVWKGISELVNMRKRKVSKDITIEINNTIEKDPKIQADAFNEFFTTIAEKVRNNLPKNPKNFQRFLRNRSQNSLFFAPITGIEVSKTISSLDYSKATGPNSIAMQILKAVLPEISNILAAIFNISLTTGKFITSLKIVKVIPIFKNKGSPLEVSNYRPISLLSNIDKILEKLVHERLTRYLEKNKFIFNRQFGFRKKHSTQHNLIAFTELIRAKLDEGNFSCGIFLDLMKAFDTVDHSILIRKLEHYGIRGELNKWFQSYLHQRHQFVCIKGTNSELRDIKHGVPQGSVLGPLLFILYINDMQNALVYSGSFIFADDTALVYSNRDLKNVRKRVNIDLKLLAHWLNANKIALNVSKTEVLLFRPPRKKINYDLKIKLCGKRLYWSKQVKYLGIILDEHLSWKFCINSVTTKLTRANGIMSNLRFYVDQRTLVAIYNALFHSHIMYAIQIWGQKISMNDRVIRLQKAAMRIMTFSNINAHTKPLFKLLKIQPIHNTIFMLNIKLIHQTLNHLSPTSVQNSLDLMYLNDSYITRARSHEMLKIPKVKTVKYGIYSVRYQSVLHWNALQSYFKETSLISLSSSKINFLTNKYLSLT